MSPLNHPNGSIRSQLRNGHGAELRPARGQRKVLALMLILAFLLLMALLNRVLRPTMAGFVPLPIQDNGCLSYETAFAKEEGSKLEKKVCFERRLNGGFVERDGAVATPYGEDGLTDYSPRDIDALKRLPGISTTRIDRFVIRGMKRHSRYYGPADLEIGAIFYDGHPVTAFSRFNHTDVYVVELRPDIDATLTTKGPIARFFAMMMKRYDRLMYVPTVRDASSSDVFEKRYYSRTTGILQGLVRYRVIRDVDGHVVGEDPDDYRGRYTMTLKVE